MQLLEQIEWVHKAGFVHHDIKPANIMIGHSDADQPTQARLIDFGMCTKWEERKSDECAADENSHFRGNLLYSSLDQMLYKPASRRDDLISVCYLLLDLNNSLGKFSSLDLDNVTFEIIFVRLRILKWQTTPEMLCETQSLLLPFVREVFSLKPNEEPFYGKLRHMLVALLLEQGVKPEKDVI